MLKMGCAKANVTPSWPTYLRGYASRNRLTGEVEEPIEVGVVALEQNDRKSLIITVDNLGIEYSYIVRITRIIAERSGIAPENILICCSHTHFAPGFSEYTVFVTGGELEVGGYPADDKYLEFWLSKVLPAVDCAIADLDVVELLQADIPVSNVAYNRRTVNKADGKVTTNYTYPANAEDYDITPIDQTMHVWKFMHGKAPKGVLVRFGCHPVTGGYNSYGISADYPYYVKQYIQEKLGCPGFFMLGTAGDVVPFRRDGESRKDIGEILACSIRLAERTFRKTTEFELKNQQTMLKLYSDILSGKTAGELASTTRSALEKSREKCEFDIDFYMADMAESMYKNFNGPEGEVPIQLLQLGDRVLVTLPFEVLTIIGEKIRAEFPDAAIVSCAGGYEGYLPCAADFPKGGYETYTGTIWNQDTGDRVVEAAVEALKNFKK